MNGEKRIEKPAGKTKEKTACIYIYIEIEAGEERQVKKVTE